MKNKLKSIEHISHGSNCLKEFRKYDHANAFSYDLFHSHSEKDSLIGWIPNKFKSMIFGVLNT